MTDLKNHLALIAAVCIWGSSYIASKIALEAFSPLLLCLIRFILSSVFMFVIRLSRKRYIPSKRDLKYMTLSAISGIAVYYALENIAVSMTSASDASLISAVYPVITILIGILFFHLKTNRNEVLGILMGVCGVIILTVTGNDGSGSMAGNALIAFNGCLWACYNYMTQRISDEPDDFTVTYYQTLIGTVCFIPMLVFEKNMRWSVTPNALIAVLYLSLICSLAALFLYNYGLRKVSAARAASLMNLMPVAGVVLSVLILHETITLKHLIGGTVIIAGVFLSAQKPKNECQNEK